MYRVSKRFHFSASHVLKGLPEGHPCGRVHGHNYVVEVVLESTALNDVGFVRDYGELKTVKDFIDTRWDHRHLNDDMRGTNPTAENMARRLFETFIHVWPELAAIKVSETPKTWAEYRP
jgi:6-pyruvoyltetrahydropterin/6-carboxytetrahydropterin synthase